VADFLRNRQEVISRLKASSRLNSVVFVAVVVFLVLIQVEWFAASTGWF
jgi:hypothetical protein